MQSYPCSHHAYREVYDGFLMLLQAPDMKIPMALDTFQSLTTLISTCIAVQITAHPAFPDWCATCTNHLFRQE